MCSFAVDSRTGVLSRTGGNQCGSPSCGFLSLGSMGITAIAEGAFSGMVHLSVLDLSSNDILSISPGTFKDLASLKTLNLRGNALTVLQNGTFQGLSSLETLSLEYNILTSLSAGAFEGLSQLRTLDLNENRLSSLGAGAFEGLSALRTLYLNRNILSDMRAVGPFSGMPQLRTLTMQNQRTYDKVYIGKHTFSGNLSQLDSLHLSFSECVRSTSGGVIELGAFDGLTGLVSLALLKVGLDDAGMPSGIFQQCRSLKYLDLYCNSLSSITEHTFSGLWYSLEGLNVENNVISSISGQAFSGFQKLKDVNLGYNQVSILPSKTFTYLTASGCWVYLYGNPLICVPDKPPRGEVSYDSSSGTISLSVCPSEVSNTCFFTTL